ncbi:uncharacterized protein CCOS01_10948 [Colletotrichum costaricense]|uniref:Uncharacterized protein n=1 Tax=Colletotrichum costaricense TaxID=1209916 RepID=A0AAI9YS63_9PEZI|nr:uncharacterized protein CCOS01_10948 [Colletotrichum costaricense]KAK1520829.1 hypothetical protein CCOS01_10948 [Colletotrichum costaricense]
MLRTDILLMIRQILRLPADGLLLLRRRQVEIKLPAAAVGAKRLLDQLSTGTIRSTPSIRTAKAWDLLWYPTLHQHCMKWTGLPRDHASSAPGPDPGTNVSLKSLVSGSLLPGRGTSVTSTVSPVDQSVTQSSDQPSSRPLALLPLAAPRQSQHRRLSTLRILVGCLHAVQRGQSRTVLGAGFLDSPVPGKAEDPFSRLQQT